MFILFILINFLQYPLRAQTILSENDSSLQILRGSLIKLQWAENEVSGISDIIAGNTYYNQNATEETFKKQAPKAGIIHLATHAIVDDENPMYSKLALAPDTTTQEDGFLNTYELYNMQLDANMVVLSACNTGYGKLIRGEGIMSLARGFIYAGCPSIIMSLWPVDDQSTSTIMKDFYSGLSNNLSKDEALRQAKLNYLKNADEVKANPFYWAGFVSIGNTNPIQLKAKINYMLWFLVLICFGVGLFYIFLWKRTGKSLKTVTFFLIFTLFILLSNTQQQHISSQTENKIALLDTIIANEYFNKAEKLYKDAQYDSSTFYFDKASVIYEKEKEYEKYSKCYYKIGNNFKKKGEYKSALRYLNKSLDIGLNKLDSNNLVIAQNYHNIGNIYFIRSEHDKALEYHHKALLIFVETCGENHPNVSSSYFNIGRTYFHKCEYDKSLDYTHKSLSINLQDLGEKHPLIARNYTNIGNIYFVKVDYDKALEYYNKSLLIQIEILGEVHHDIAISYMNIGIIYGKKGNYNKAYKFLNKSLSLMLKISGINNPTTTKIYFNIGWIFHVKGDYDKALEFYNKSLLTRIKIFGENDLLVAKTLGSIGTVYLKQNFFIKAFYYYQKSISSLIPDFKEIDIYTNPTLKNMSSESYLLTSLVSKAEAFEKYYSSQSNQIKDIKMSVSTYELASELIDKMKCSYNRERSKLFLGKKVYEIYEKAIKTTLKLYRITGEDEYKEKAFTFAEKSKSSVLLQAISESKAKYFGGISDTLLEKERELKINLSFYSKRLYKEREKRENADSTKISLWQNKLFTLHNEYDALINQFEKEYPEYYNLKYETHTASSKEIQENIVDENSALVEYFTGDSSIFIFTITQNDFDATLVKKDSLFEEQIKSMRSGLIDRDYALYTKHAYKLYQTLIEPIEAKIKNKNLIIIPDGILGYIPFETLISENADQERKDYRNLSYLINDYQMTYSYSSTLLYDNMTKENNDGKNDFLGMAPVSY
jgi:CHAT domain-containing protein